MKDVSLETVGQGDPIYDQGYYQNYYGGIPYNRDEPHWIRFFGGIAERIIQHVHPKSAFDLGCAKGFLVGALRDRGVDAYGADVSKYAISQVREDIRSVCRVGSVVDKLDQPYDVITCIEVLEHVTEEEAKVAIRNMTTSTRHILFSSTPDEFDDPTHINVHPVIYWLELFGEHGFKPDLSFDTDYVVPWAVFLKKDEHPVQRDFLRCVARCADLKMELNKKNLKVAQLEGFVLTQQQMILSHEARIRRLQDTLNIIRTVTGWRWMKGAYRRLSQIIRPVLKASSASNRNDDKQVSITDADSLYQSWIQKNEPGPDDLKKMSVEAKAWPYRPKISLITPVYDTDRYALIRCIGSVIQQTYDNWELCLADGGSTQDYVKQIIKEYAGRDARIRYVRLPRNLGIAGNSNEALKMASGDYVALLDHDDMLSPVALHEVAKLFNESPDVDFVYSDEDKIPAANEQRYNPFFKPDWSPDTFLSYNYVCHFAVIRKTIMDRVGGFREGYDGAQDYELFLRIVQQTNRIRRIPKVLYHWRAAHGSVASNILAKPDALDAAKRAIGEYLEGRGVEADVVDGKFPTSYRVKYKIQGEPKVSIIIPTRDKVELLSRCVSSILEKTDDRWFELLIVDNGSKEQETRDYLASLREDSRIRILSYDNPFNFSAINNFAVQSSTTDYILFLNNDTEVITPEWLSAMLEFAQRNEVGAVGAKLYYPDDTVQHGGIVVGPRDLATYAHRKFPRSSDGYIGRLSVIQNLSAVTAACMMMRRKVFLEVGGFDERLSHRFHEIDLCLKLRKQGYLIVFSPYAELYHHESASGGDGNPSERQARLVEEKNIMTERWKQILDAGDPYYGQNLTLEMVDVRITARNVNSTKPKFSIIIVDCESHTPRDTAKRGVDSILSQTFRDFEVIFLHDGVKQKPYEREFDLSTLTKVKTVYTNTRYKDWGHSLRNYGMRIADGEYILNFNIDNLLYPTCLEKINDCLEKDKVRKDIVIFTIIHHKHTVPILTGDPVMHAQIDCLQLVASREAWRSIGFWHSTDYDADGYLYMELCSQFKPFYINEILAENF